MTNSLSSTQEKPHHLFFHSEALRSLGEMLTLPLSLPLLQRAPKGDGHTVMVIPGFTADDSSTRALRKFLISQGYDARGWDLGVNLGVREEMFERCLEHAQALHAHSGEKITLIGQSLGGIYARELSRAAEGLVRQVVCLGSPVDRRRGDGSRITPLYKIINRKYLEADNEAMVHQMASEPPVPTSMIYSREDGIVHWTTCQQDDPSHQAENIRVFGSHSGMGFNPAIYYVIADRLSQSEGEWQRFNPPLWLRALVPAHKH